MKFYILLALICSASTATAQEVLQVFSPDKKIRVKVNTGRQLTYSVYYNDSLLLSSSVIGLHTTQGDMPSKQKDIRNTTRSSTNAVIISPVPEKRIRIPDIYNEMKIRFKDPFGLTFRVYNDGVAYRIETFFKDSIVIISEDALFRFTSNHPVYYPEVIKRDNTDIFHTSFEEPYQYKPLDSLLNTQLFFTPVLVTPGEGPNILVTESDLEDYPGMFLTGNSDSSLNSNFATYPKSTAVAPGEYPQVIITGRENYIARTKGTRSLPWRVMLIGNDKNLPVNDLVYRLAAPSRVNETSWIKPGKGTDEWITGINLFNIPFKAGINTATYKYYIDFAKRFGFQRIMMDAGWSDTQDLFRINKDISMDSISQYAKSQGIGLSMGTLAMTLDRQLDSALDQFKKWGVDFIMTDFMDRDDQQMVRFYTRVAKACADKKILVMFHGAYKPAGFNRTWPNAVTREGVLGSEFNIWSDKPTPKHNLLLPFIRMAAGPMDYEPGILDNATAAQFRPIGEKVMAMGTRCHQAAMFVVYESPIQLFSGNISQGLKEPEFMELVGSVPTTWDTTIILEAKIGEYIVTARKKGDEWFIGAMCDWTARVFDISLDFLGKGSYAATICVDGVNAARYPSDYSIHEAMVNGKQSYTLRLAPGGGQLIRLRKLPEPDPSVRQPVAATWHNTIPLPPPVFHAYPVQ